MLHESGVCWASLTRVYQRTAATLSGSSLASSGVLRKLYSIRSLGSDEDLHELESDRIRMSLRLTHELVLPIWKSNVSLTLMLDKRAKR